MVAVARRPYWPSGVKLDSIITTDPTGTPSAHIVRWVLTWPSPTGMTNADYYAHDLYLDKDGGTFLSHDDAFLLEATTPQTKEYRYSDGGTRLRIGWASYRPGEIVAGTTYTISMISAPTPTVLDAGAEDIETFGLRLPSTCIANCIWVPLSWCSVAKDGATILLRNNTDPAGIQALGEPLGGCNTLWFLPMVVR